MTPAVLMEGVWKQYPAGGLLSRARHVFRAGRTTAGLGVGPGWALRDVTFALEPGHSLGIIGRNGAGKTTALRLLTGITAPTAGRLRTRGRVASLIALGAGFHPELTGRENVYLNAVILGLTRAEVRAKFDEIVDFAELSPHIDTPVKYYSSGMYARLGFSVAVHVDPDVLLVDEVLSVGDLWFQSKSYQKMLSFRTRGCTIVFVSHRISAVTTMCQDVVWLDRGVVRQWDTAAKVTKAYLEEFDRTIVAAAAGQASDQPGTGELIVEHALVLDDQGTPRREFRLNDSVTIELRCRVQQPLTNPWFLISVARPTGEVLFSANMALDGFAPGRFEPGAHTVRCTFDSVPLLPGPYYVITQVLRDITGDSFPARPMAGFSIVGSMADYGFSGPAADGKIRGSAAVHVPYSWDIHMNRTP